LSVKAKNRTGWLLGDRCQRWHVLNRHELHSADLLLFQPVTERIKTAEQRTIIQQYGNWYTDRWWVGCYIWYIAEGTGRSAAPPSPIVAVSNVTTHPPTASVPTYIHTSIQLKFDSAALTK